jgi:hypothetical protein
MINKNCQNNRLNNYGITERDSEKTAKVQAIFTHPNTKVCLEKVHKSPVSYAGRINESLYT